MYQGVFEQQLGKSADCLHPDPLYVVFCSQLLRAHANNFITCIFKFDVRISVHRNTDIGMAHQVLQRFRVHAGGHIAAIGVAADVRRYARHLQAVKADKPFSKCVTDITEVKAKNGKLYVSAIVRNKAAPQRTARLSISAGNFS